LETNNYLESELIKLRAPEIKDLDLLYKWENDTLIWIISGTVTPFSRLILKKYLHTAHQDIYQAKQLRLMIDSKNTLQTIGTIDLFDFDPVNARAGVGILIGEDKERQKGNASEALRILIDYSFDILHLHQLYCNITSDNIGSLKLFQHNGFEIAGRKKEWIRIKEGWTDELLLQLINPRIE
jgi:diamine N-acetyltransferase